MQGVKQKVCTAVAHLHLPVLQFLGPPWLSLDQGSLETVQQQLGPPHARHSDTSLTDTAFLVANNHLLLWFVCLLICLCA